MRRARNVVFVKTTLFMLFLGFLGLPAAAQSGRTFYIDYASGSNKNPGTKAAPWKTHPHMQTSASCTSTGSGPSYTHSAGDHFVFKGGVTWPSQCFPLNVPAGGSANAGNDYYGVDLTWYSGSSFARPLWDMNYQPVPGGHVFNVADDTDYVTIDNIEIRYQQITGSCANVCGGNGGSGYATQAAVNFTDFSGYTPVSHIVSNMYIHDWMTLQSTACVDFLNYGAGAIFGATLVTDSEISDANGYMGSPSHHMSFGGADEQRPGMQGTEIANSKFHDTMAAAFGIRKVHDSEFYHITSEVGGLDPCIHTQVIENDDSGVDTIYNNIIHDNGGSFQSAGQLGVVIYEGPYSTIYNNIMWSNNTSGNGHILISEDNSGPQPNAVQSTYNNILDCSGNSAGCFGTDSKTPLVGTVNLRNNIFITNSGNAIEIQQPIHTFVNSNNYIMSTSEAAKYGFVGANKYMPTSPDPNVLGKGANLSALCSGVLSNLCSDTEGAEWFGASYVSRGSTWDFGAYVLSGQEGSQPKPVPPVDLKVVVQ